MNILKEVADLHTTEDALVLFAVQFRERDEAVSGVGATISGVFGVTGDFPTTDEEAEHFVTETVRAIADNAGVDMKTTPVHICNMYVIRKGKLYALDLSSYVGAVQSAGPGTFFFDGGGAQA